MSWVLIVRPWKPVSLPLPTLFSWVPRFLLNPSAWSSWMEHIKIVSYSSRDFLKSFCSLDPCGLSKIRAVRGWSGQLSAALGVQVDVPSAKSNGTPKTLISIKACIEQCSSICVGRGILLGRFTDIYKWSCECVLIVGISMEQDVS